MLYKNWVRKGEDLAGRDSYNRSKFVSESLVEWSQAVVAG
jgi:hypothetical protein